MRMLVLSHSGDAYQLARQAVEGGYESLYFQYQNPPLADEDGSGVHHIEAWRPYVDEAAIVVCDNVYFSSKPGGLVDSAFGFADGLSEMYTDRGSVFLRRLVPTAPGRSYDGVVWGFFAFDRWLQPFVDVEGRATRRAQAAGEAVLSPIEDVLRRLRYVGPLQAAWTRVGKAICLIDILPNLGYGTLMKVAAGLGTNGTDFLIGTLTGAVLKVAVPRRKWWRFW